MRPRPQDSAAVPHSVEQDTRIRETLERVLASPAFRNSKQTQKFLRYVVEHSHTGEEERLKERTIGVEVFGRDPAYDTADDPVVRVRASEVRKRLAQYYQESGVPGDVRFEVPSGSYRVDFHWPEAATSLEGRITARGPWRLGLMAVCLFLSVAAIVFLYSRKPKGILDEFWAPVLTSPKPVLLYCGQPVVYFLSREVHENYRSTMPADQQQRGAYTVKLEPDAPLRGKDIVPVTDQFVGIGNAHTSALLSAMFAARGKPVEIRYANDLSFSDLRSSPAVLIGAFSNLWTLEMTGQLRFVFEQDKGVRRIRDRSNNKTWQLANLSPDGKTPEDYAIVSRLFDSATGQLLISAAGITQYGTRSAGEFLTDPVRLAEALSAGGWAKKNVQVLLHTTIYKGTPGTPKIVSTHVW